MGAAAELLGSFAHLEAVAAVAGLPLEVAARTLDELVEAGRLTSAEPIAFADADPHGSSYLDRLPPGSRALMHAAAAKELDRRGAPREAVAWHLLRAPGEGDRGTVEVLLAQAEHSLATGEPEYAARCLERALREPPAPDQLLGALLALGRARLGRGEIEEALAVAERARSRAGEPDERVAASELAFQALIRRGAPERALDLIVGEIDALRPRDPNAALRLEVALLREAPGHPSIFEEGIRRHPSVELDPELEATADYELAFGQVTSLGGRASAAEAVAVVEPALELGIAAKRDLKPLLHTLWLLSRAEAPERARELLAAIERQVPAQAESPAVRAQAGLVELRFGSVREAVVILERSLAAGEASGDAEAADMSAAFLANALLEAGESERLERLIEMREPSFDSLWEILFAVAVARRCMWEGDYATAVEGLLKVEEIKQRLGLPNPAGFDHLSYAAACLVELGDLNRAGEIAADNLERARLWDAPGCLALAEAAAARCRSPRAAVPLLEAALERASGSAMRTVEARVAIALGQTQVLAGHRARAVESFQIGLDAASRAEAERIGAVARQGLSELGRRPRGDYVRGIEALTPAELRVARLAARGGTNKEIAADAFLSVRTVENHLRSIYRKLDTDRAGLAGLLGPDSTR